MSSSKLLTDSRAEFINGHVVRRQVPPTPRDTDVVVVAGNTCEGVVEGIAYLREAIPREFALVTVAGNHEFYRRSGRKRSTPAAGMHSWRRYAARHRPAAPLRALASCAGVGSPAWFTAE
jgi:hypothetical protein